MLKSWHLTYFLLLIYLLTLIRPSKSVVFPAESGLIKQTSLSTYVFQSGVGAYVYFPSICVFVMVLQTLPFSSEAADDMSATLNAIIPGDITLGGLFPIHDKSNDPTMPCGRSINAERGIQVIETLFFLCLLSKYLLTTMQIRQKIIKVLLKILISHACNLLLDKLL